tara:strand:- start:84 stop:578 length:495 start_codon:yes stop_codon:yes gene_type:complete
MKKQNLTLWQQNFLSRFATATTAINQVDLLDERGRPYKFVTESTHNGTLFFIKDERHGRTYYAPNPKNGLIFQHFNQAGRKVEHLEVKQSNLKPFCETVNVNSKEMSELVIKKGHKPFHLHRFHYSLSAFMRKSPKPSQIEQFAETLSPLFPVSDTLDYLSNIK